MKEQLEAQVADCNKSQQSWKDAIAYGEQLLVEAKGKKRRVRLAAAIEHFKHRLDAGASYPGLPVK